MRSLLAEFETADALSKGAGKAGESGFVTRDALTPYPVAALDGLIEQASPRVRVPMAIAGFGTAAAMFGLEWWSAARAYPFNEGGRPLFSWQVFTLVPFEVGVLAAGLAGFVAMCVHCGLPRLHHPMFATDGIERASQDRFFLVFDDPGDENLAKLRAILLDAGALRIAESGA